MSIKFHHSVLIAAAFGAVLGAVMTSSAHAREKSGQVAGYYSHGHLLNGSRLPREGKGFVELFDDRQCVYGSDGLVELIEKVASELADRFPGTERLQVGDLSREGGGQLNERHASHQNGLDADLAYLRNDHREQKIPDPENGFDEYFVDHGKLSPNFDKARNLALFQLLAASGRLETVFMDPVIKRALCLQARDSGQLDESYEALRRMTSYPGHDDHFHIRLSCPKESPRCIPYRIKTPVETGCETFFNKVGRK